jgi:BlaI family transcriptional regulator, penicillinase repressor
MQKLKKISDSEYVIMQVLWDKAPVSSAEIVSSLKDATGWDPKTIHTFLRRLMSKGIVNALKEGSFYKYSPNISRSEYTISETKSFVKKIYDGSISNLIISFVKQEELSKEEVKKLKEILEAAERES